MRHLTRDIGYAWRGLLRSPLFTAVALLSIALGIGANTAVYTLVQEVLLQLLPVKAPQQLVLFNGARFENHYGSNSGGNMLSFPMYEDFRDNFVDGPTLRRITQPVPNPAPTPKIFSGLFARREIAMNVGFNGSTERVLGELVSGTYFSVLGVRPAAGRLIAPEDDRDKGAGLVAVLSFDYWRNRYGADRAIIGRTIVINNNTLTIIGVSQAGFTGLNLGVASSVYVPVTLKAQMTPNWDDVENRRSRWVNVFGRLKPGVTQDQALAILQPFFHGILEQEVQAAAFANTTAYTRQQFLKGTMSLLPASHGRAPLRQQLTEPLWLLFGIVAGVLLIACANVASLLIARAAARQKEIALRLAIGASRGRIVGQLLVESVMLAGLGGLLGLAVAAWTTKFLLGFLPTSDNAPHVISGAIDYRVLGFNFALSLATGLLFGLVPALRSTKPDLAPVLKDQAGSVVGGGVRVRKALVVAQVTVSILLLVSAGLFIRTLRNLRLVDLGINPESVIAFNISPTLSGYTPERTPALYKSLADRLQTEPGVRGVAFARMGLLEDNEWDSTVTVEGYQARPGEQMNPYCNSISPGYFRTMGIPVLEGREFDAHDDGAAPAPPANTNDGRGNGYRHVIVNERFATKYFGDRDPIGRHIGFGGNPGTPTPIEIVGVVRDSKYTGVRDEIPRTVFFPMYEERTPGGMVVYVRTTTDPSAAFSAAQRTMRDLDRNVPVYNMRTLERQIDRSLLVERFVATLSTAFGIVATLLAVVGLYGVMAYTVAQRTREIGVRMALGAERGDVVWLVMRDVLLLVGTGIALGLAAAWGATRGITSQLYGVSAGDPLTILAAAVLLSIVAVLAGYIPAWRATRVNPVRALRYE